MLKIFIESQLPQLLHVCAQRMAPLEILCVSSSSIYRDASFSSHKPAGHASSRRARVRTASQNIKEMVSQP